MPASRTSTPSTTTCASSISCRSSFEEVRDGLQHQVRAQLRSVRLPAGGLAAEHQRRPATGCSAAMAVRLEVVADDHHLTGRQAEVIEREPEEGERGLADELRLHTRGVLQRCDERAGIEDDTVHPVVPDAVLVEGEERGAAPDPVIRTVETLPGEVAADVAHHDPVGALFVLLDTFEVLARRRGKEERRAGAPGVEDAPAGQGARSKDFPILD